MVEFYVDVRVVLILVFAHGPSSLLALTGQGKGRIAQCITAFSCVVKQHAPR